MLLALRLAEQGRCTVSPNPMVGAVVMKENQIVGQGFHQRAGSAHAEIVALRQAGSQAKNASLYVTLEPCCHHGRTPPCIDAIIQAGIKKVYVACLDPNPLMAGKGVLALQNAGIEVEVGLCEAEAKKLNEIFFHYITQKRPFVIAKWAMSLDGKTITHPNDARDISCHESVQDTHDMRQQVDAILVGATTAIRDNPLLTSRLPNAAKQPIRIILSTQCNLPPDLNVFNVNHPGKTIIATTQEVNSEFRSAIENPNVEFLVVKKNKEGQIDLPSLLDALGKREITSLLVEGGMTVHESFFKEKCVNKIQVYLAPMIIGSLEKKNMLPSFSITPIGRDYCVTASIGENNYV